MEIRVDQVEKRSWLEIDLKQLENNFYEYKRALKKDAQIIAVIKADAYGHGDVQVARMLSNAGVSLFAVSNIDEAVGLRNSGVQGEILILGYSSPTYARTLHCLNLTQSIVSEEYAEALVKTGYEVKCQFAIDTGMTRVGISANNIEEASSIIRNYANKLKLNGIFTHLCVADSNSESDKDFTRNQLEKFKAIADNISDLQLPYIHCYNSAGGLFYLYDDDFNKIIGKIVRLGIVLYGLKPDISNILPEGIKPALTWKSVISMVKNVPAGQSVGYGRTFVTQKDSRIATVTTGYADGYRRELSNKGFVLINGKKAPVVGRVCMDQILIDVTDIDDVNMGKTVTLIGESNGIIYSADDMAMDLNTIGYEIVCSITKRVQRFYKQ